MHYASITDRLAGLGSEKWRVHARGRELLAQGHPVIEFTIGEPDIAPDPRLLDICNEAMRAGRTRYSNGRGEPALLAALAAKYSKRTGRSISTSNALYFPGTQTALYAVLTGLVEAGDKVLVPDPYYATYEGVVRAPGAEIVPVPMSVEDGFHLRADVLEAAITADCRVLLLNNPHNPTGAVLSKAEIQAIGEVCRRHDLWIICDEVYEELTFGAEFVSPFDLPELADRTIVVSSISKSHAAPGFRAGWAIGPEEFCERILPFSETMLFGGQPFISDMAAYALTHDLPTSATMRGLYQSRSALIVERLRPVAGVRPLMPEAGMFILLDVSGTGLDGEEFANRLLEEHYVSTMPGTSFGEAARNLVRMSVTVPEQRIEEACDRIAHFVRTLNHGAESLIA